MPIYEYQCKTCGRKLEKRQKFSDAPLTVCPNCSGTLEQLISAPAVQFKGGGWYADGYGSKASAKSDTSEGGSSASSSGESGAAATSGGAESSSSSGDSAAAGKTSSGSSDSSSSSNTASSASSASAASSTPAK